MTSVWITKRQLEVWALQASGYRQKEIADKLGISIKTVGATIADVYDKIGAHSLVESFVAAVRLGIVPLPNGPDIKIVIGRRRPRGHRHDLGLNCGPRGVRRAVV